MCSLDLSGRLACDLCGACLVVFVCVCECLCVVFFGGVAFVCLECVVLCLHKTTKSNVHAPSL